MLLRTIQSILCSDLFIRQIFPRFFMRHDIWRGAYNSNIHTFQCSDENSHRPIVRCQNEIELALVLASKVEWTFFVCQLGRIICYLMRFSKVQQYIDTYTYIRISYYPDNFCESNNSPFYVTGVDMLFSVPMPIRSRESLRSCRFPSYCAWTICPVEA